MGCDLGWVGTFDGVVGWLGRFKWLYDYQTFIGALVALGAAYWTLRAIKLQVLQSRSSTKLQLAQVERHERERREAKRAAARAVLPLSLGVLGETARQRSQALLEVLGQCQDNFLPKIAVLPKFDSYSADVLSNLKEMVEFSTEFERKYYSRLIISIQLQASKLGGLSNDHSRPEAWVHAHNVEALILGEAEIYARASALFAFARGATNDVPLHIVRREISAALFLTGLHQIRDELIERYDLESDQIWEPTRKHGLPF
ncbi:hypothetical protein BHMPCIPO_02834 [Ensifer sesbaniae]|nr:hypothetical protein [Ensifer sesbaniae]